MNNYKRIGKNHPWMVTTATKEIFAAMTDLSDNDSMTDLSDNDSIISNVYERTFHRENELWPLYSISVWLKPFSFTVHMNTLRSMNSFWEPCGIFNPVPDELFKELVELLSDIQNNTIDPRT